MSSEPGDPRAGPPRPGGLGLRLSNVVHAYATTVAIDHVSFDVAPHEIVALLGPSGSGKSTLLSIIAGLLDLDSGEVAWRGRSLAGIPPHRRGFGLMFQDLALFPHLDVGGNVAYGLRASSDAGGDEAAVRKRVDELLEWVGLAGYADRPVQTLSGGEQQRVALARSLAPRPRLLMLDEPLGALDRILRERLLGDLADWLHRLRQTALYVTHDQEEAFALADRVVVLHAGKVAQIGEPFDIYRRPASAFVARFLGMSNVFDPDGTLDGLPAPPEIRALLPGANGGHVLLRSDAARIGSDGGTLIHGRLDQAAFRGPGYRCLVVVSGLRLTFDLPADSLLPPLGGEIVLSLDPPRAFQILP